MNSDLSSLFYNMREKLREKIEYWGGGIIDDDVMDLSTYDLHDAIQSYKCFKLYRYMPATYYSIRNFEKGIIHLSPNGVMNDIYEGVPNLQEELSYYQLKKLSDLAFMTCLSETHDNTLMWSHYANNHEGICVEYDLKLLQNDPLKICNHLFPVLYCDTRLITPNIQSLINSHCELKKDIDEGNVYEGSEPLNNILPMFLTKGTVWAYEQEWRIIYTKKQIYDANEEILYSGSLPFPCISAVYLGYRINPEIKENIVEIADRIRFSKNREIEVYQAKLESAGYKIGFERIS